MTGPRNKLEILKGGFESGAIDKSEYEESTEKAKQDSKEPDKIPEELGSADAEESQPKSSDKVLIISIALIILLLISVFAYSFFNKPRPKTLEELHVLNLKGELKPEQGYVYKGAYSFITLDNLWYTQLTSPKGTKIYSLALRYSPKDLEDIKIEGTLNADFFNNQSEFFVTFNPTGGDFSSIGLAVADFNTHLSKVFEKKPIAACDRNETDPCKTRPIVTCDDNDKVVLYIKASDRLRAYYSNNCIVVEGKGFDLVKGVDRILYNLYDIMGKEEA